MGADMIGYILVGPKTIKTPLPEKIVKDARKLVEAAKKAVTNEEGFIDPGSDCFYEENLSPAERKLVEGFEVNDLEHIADMDADKVLDEFLAVWNDSFRDTMSREYGKNQKIVVAGEMSWGDEPEGDGYCAIRDAALLRYFKPLGIK